MMMISTKIYVRKNDIPTQNVRGHNRSWLLMSGVCLLTALIVVILGAPYITHYDLAEQDPAAALQTPSKTHWFGTDRFGRDILTRILYGGRITLAASSVALLLVVTIGLTVGIMAGYAGGIFGAIAMRIVDVLLAFPSIIIGLVIAGLFGPGLMNVLIAVTSVWWVSFARLTYGIVLQVKEEPSVDAARALGARPLTMMLREILPKVIGPVMVLATLELGSLIIWISGLSFLGLGAQPPSPEWGAMLSDGRAYFIVFPHLMIFPGLMIFITVFALVMIGEGLRDVLDPDRAAVRRTST